MTALAMEPADDFQAAYARWVMLTECPDGDWTEQMFEDWSAAERTLLSHRPASVQEAVAMLRVLEHSLADSHRVDRLDRAAVSRLRRVLPKLTGRAA
jgi:hypothetical protein